MRAAQEVLPYARVYSSKIVGLGLGVVLTASSARLLQPEGRGVYALVTAGLLIGVQLLNFGLSSSLIVLFAERPARIREQLAKLWLCGAGWALLLAFLGDVIHRFPLGLPEVALRWWPFWALWIPLQLLGLYHAAALQALRAARQIAWLELGGRASAVLFGLSALLLFPGQVAPFVIALILSDALVALAGGGLLYRGSAPVPAADREAAGEFWRKAWGMGLRALPLLLLPYLLIKIDILLLNGFRGDAETGIYSVASQVVDIGMILPATIAGLGVATIIQGADRAEATLKLYRPAITLVLIGCVLLAAVGPWLIVLLFGRAYENAYWALLILLPGFLSLSSVTVLSQFFAVRGFPLFLSKFWLIGLALNVALNMWAIPRYGMLGAAATSAVAYALVNLLVVRRFLRETGLQARNFLGKESA